MKTQDNLEKSETDRFLPSGHWDGFYCYHHSPRQHKMSSDLFFSKGRVSGSGTDDVSLFSWNGSYHLEEYKITMSKNYSTHTVNYSGDIDENGIWGTWEIKHDFSRFPHHLVAGIKEAFKDDLTGGFHIWPRTYNVEFREDSLAESKESEKLKELFIEIFA